MSVPDKTEVGGGNSPALITGDMTKNAVLNACSAYRKRPQRRVEGLKFDWVVP